MKEILRNRKWQLLSLILATALITSISLNIYQNFGGFNGASMNFTFTWEPDTQEIVQGTFVLEIWLIPLYGEKLTIIIKANDDDYNQRDYIGLVFDTNQNGSIDAGLTGDESYGLFADNYTIPVSRLNNGCLKFLVYTIILGPHRVSFTDEGYIFTIQFPFYNWNPASLIKKGNNPLHICYHDRDVRECVFVPFSFFIAEEA